MLLYPWPVGAGHTGRLLAFAQLLREAGHECVFAFDPSGGWVAKEGFEVLVAEVGTRRRSTRPVRSGYRVIRSLDAAFSAHGYYHVERISKDVQRDLAALAAASVDAIVTHMQPTAAIAARVADVPLVSIAEADFLTPGAWSWMPWAERCRERLDPFPPSCPSFNLLLDGYGLPPITDVSDLLWGDVVLLASTPELDPLGTTDAIARVHYVGPLIWAPRERETEEFFERCSYPSRPHVYVTSGSGEVGPESLVDVALRAAEEQGWSLFASTGYRGAGDGALVTASAVRQLGGLRAALRWADVAICHGGHSTILAGLAEGRPMVVAPALSENEANGRRMLQGAGFLLHQTEVEESTGRLLIRPRFGPPADVLQVTVAQIVSAVEELSADDRYLVAARRHATQLARWRREGPERLYDAMAEVA